MLTKSKAFGKALKKIRLKKKLTQEDLSLEAQLARVYISELEYGKKIPSIETIFKLSKGLNIKCSKLMDLTEQEFLDHSV
ncbi:MAG: helix-turn-helix transcriptional regulator [Bacteroidota bacterium]|jgi:transcriptional regulator with XRE-family HTH domain